MEPSKRKFTDITPVERLQAHLMVPLPATDEVPPQAKTARIETFDLEGFKVQFDKGTQDEKYLLLRTLTNLNTSLPISDLQTFVRKYTDFKNLNLGAFLSECKRDPVMACAKHFGKLAQLEQRHVVNELRTKINAAAGSERPAFLSSANLLGDYFINGTIIEGANLNTASGMFKRTFEIAKEVYGYTNPKMEGYINELKDWSDKLKVIQDSLQASDDPSYEQDELKELSKEMLETLQRKGEVLLPGGYKYKEGGHALLYHIRLDKGLIIFDIYNSGEGIGVYHSASLGAKNKAHPVFRVVTDEVERLNPHFLAVLLGNNIQALFQDNERNASDVYEFVIKALNIQKVDPVNEGDYITPQRSGTCVTRCILAFLHQNMSKEDYSRFKHYAQEIHVCLMDKNDPQTQTVFPHIAANLYRNIDKQFEDKQISFKDFFRTYALLNDSQVSPDISSSLMFPQNIRYNTQIPLEKNDAPQQDKKVNSLIQLFNDPSPPIPIVTPITNDREMLAKLGEWTRTLTELIKLNKKIEAALFYKEIIVAMPEIRNTWITDFSPEEVDVVGKFLLILGSSLTILENHLNPDSKIYRCYLFGLHVHLCKSILTKLYPKAELAKQLEPYSHDCISDFYNLEEDVSPDTNLKFWSAKNYFNGNDQEFSDKSWFDIVQGYIPLISFGNESSVVAFINAYYKAAGKISEIPKPFDNTWYMDVFRANIVGLPSYIYDLVTQYRTLLTDARSNVGWVQGEEFYEGEMQLLGRWLNDSDFVKEMRFPEKPNDEKHPNIRIHTLLKKLGKDPNLLRLPAFQKKLRSAFFKTRPFHPLFREELETEEAPRFLNRLKDLLTKQVAKAIEENDAKTFLFLLSFTNDIHTVFKISKPELISFGFDRIISVENFEKLEPRVPNELRQQFTLQLLRLNEKMQLFDEKWLRRGLGFLTGGAADKNALYYEGCLLLRHRSNERKNLFENASDKDALLRRLRLDPIKSQIKWPLITCDNLTFDLMTGEYAQNGKMAVVYQAKDNDAKGVKIVFAKGERLTKFTPDSLSGREIGIRKQHPNNPLVTGKKLEELYPIKLNEAKKWFTYNSDLASPFLRDIFRIDRFSCWLNVNEPIQYIIDTQSKRVIRGVVDAGQNVFYSDLTNDMTLIHHKNASDAAKQLNSIFNRFDDPDQYLVWQKNQSNDLFVEFPAYDLNFDVSFNDDKIYCRNHPEFYIAPQQITWLHSNHGLTLINDNGEKLFLLADKKYNTANQASIAYKSKIERIGDKGQNKIITLKVVPPTKLQTQESFEGSNWDRLHFARYLAAIGEFETAIRVIKTLTTSLYDDEVAILLETILNEKPFTFFQGDPHFQAFMMYVSYFWLTIKKDKAIERRLLSQINVYAQNYISNVTNVSLTSRLDLEQLSKISLSIRNPQLAGWIKSSVNNSPTARHYTLPPTPQPQANTFFRILHSRNRMELRLEPERDECDYYSPEDIPKGFLPLFKLICTGIIEDNRQNLEKGLFPAIYNLERHRDHPNNLYAKSLILLANRPEYHVLLKKLISREEISSEDPEEWNKLLEKFLKGAIAFCKENESVPLQGAGVSLKEEKNEVEMSSTPPPFLQKRKTSAPTSPSKEAKREEKEATLRDLFERYFTKEIDSYNPVRLQLNAASTAAQQIFQKINEDIVGNQSQKRYVLKNPEQLPALKKDLENFIAHYQRADDAEALVKELSNYHSSASEEELVLQLKYVAQQKGGKKAENTLKVLLDRYLVSDEHPFATPELAEAVTKWINQLLYLNAAKAALKEDNLHLMAALLKRGIRDDALISRVSSYFEMVGGKMLRKRQWKILQTTQVNEKQVFQLSSGEGKTSVITRNLVLAELAKNRSVFNIVPKSNLETDYENLRRFFAENTNYHVRLFSFDRNMTTADLELLAATVSAARLNQIVFVTDPCSIQAVLLKYFEALISGETEQIGHLEKVVTFLLENSTALIDEEHIVLSPLHYLNYASKEEKPLDQFHWDVSGKLFDLMQEYNQNAKEDHFPIGKWNQAPFSADHYHASQKPLLINVLSEKIYPQLERVYLKAYLGADVEKINDSERDVLKEWLRSLPSSLVNELELMRAQLNIFLPHTLGLRSFVNYGPGEGVDFAIPYKGNLDPSYKSSFQNNDIMLNVTEQLYRLKGLDKGQLKKLVELWRVRQQMLGEKPFPDVNIFDFDLENQNQINHLHAKLGNDPKAIKDYLNYIVFPEIRVQTHRYASTAYDLSNLLFPRMTAFTATLLSNYATLPKDVMVHFDGKVHAEMIDLLHKPSQTTIVVQEKLDFKSLLGIPHVCMVLDPHALLEGRSNESVAKELLEAGDKRFGRCEFYNNKTNVLTSTTFAQGDPNRTLTYLDQIHTTGVDTVQPADGVGVLLANKNLTFTELLQAAKRLRGYGKGQKIVIAATKELEESILKTVGLPKLTNQAIVLWTLLNEASQLQKITSVSFDQQLQSIYRGGLLARLLQTPDPLKKAAIVKKFQLLMKEPVNSNEFKELASLDMPKTPLQKFLDKCEEYKLAFSDLLDSKKEAEIESLKVLAANHLAGQKNDSSEQLNITAQKEQQIYKETEDELNVSQKSGAHINWTAKEVALSETFMKDWSTDAFKTLYELTNKSNFESLSMLPFSFLTGKIPVRDDLFVSGNFIKGHYLFEKLMPKIEYILDMIGLDNSHKYMVVSRTEANQIRDSWEYNINNLWKEKNAIKMNLYQADGYRVTGGLGGDPHIDKEIIAIANFFNGETRLEGDAKEEMKKWLSKGTAEKIDRFVKSAYYRKATHQRNLQGTVIQKLFDELLKK